MGVAERRTREKLALRQEILAAARKLFVEEGYDAVSMRRIAEKIEYSPTTIYLHFKDKADLLFQLCEESFAKLRRQLETLSPQDGGSLGMLRKGLRTYVDFGLKHPQHYTVTFMVPHQHDEPDDDARYKSPETEGMKAFAFLRASVEAAVRDGKLKPGDVDATARALWAGVHGITSLLISFPTFPWGDREKVIDTLIETMLDGLKGEG